MAKNFWVELMRRRAPTSKDPLSARGAERGTPYVAVDYDRMMKNIVAMQERANRHGVRLRPHVKTHKCLEIARLQIEAGAAGVTASKPDEALVFINGGIRSLTIAYPVIDPNKLDRILDAARQRGTAVAFIADSLEGVTSLAETVGRHGRPVGVYVKVDVGLGRIGVSPGDGRLLELANAIRGSAKLFFAGLLSHAGHAYAGSSIEDVRAIGRREAQILTEARNELGTGLGVQTPEISVGATPTALADAIYPPATEIRPGNYVFSDLTQLRIGVCSPDALALSIVASIISVSGSRYIIDAGSKVMSSDLGAHGTGSQDPTYGLAAADGDQPDPRSCLAVQMLSEEHGFVNRGNTNFPVGTRLRVFPKHSCSVVNLTDWLVIERGGVPHDTWPVAARGKVQ